MERQGPQVGEKKSTTKGRPEEEKMTAIRGRREGTGRRGERRATRNRQFVGDDVDSWGAEGMEWRGKWIGEGEKRSTRSGRNEEEEMSTIRGRRR